MLIVFDDMIEGIKSNKKLSSKVTESFLRRRNLIFYLFSYQSYFKVPKTIKLNATHYFMMKVLNKNENSVNSFL